jgi:hypothetical protein
LVRSSDETSLVVDIEPTGREKNITKIGRDSYPTAEEAEADVKRLCKSEAKLKQNPQTRKRTRRHSRSEHHAVGFVPSQSLACARQAKKRADRATVPEFLN